MHFSMEELAFFNQQLASIIRLEMPLAEGIETLARECKTAHFKEVLEQIHKRIKNGARLSQALQERPEIFPPAYVAMIAAGEATGDLYTPLEKMVDYSETTLELKTSLINAFLYPAIILCIAMGLVVFIMGFIVPHFKDIFFNLGVSLPALTIFILRISDFLQENYMQIFYVVLCLGIFLYLSYRLRWRWLESLCFHFPFFGRLLRISLYIRFSMLLSDLLAQEIPLKQALEITKSAFRNSTFYKAIHDMQMGVEKGGSLSSQMEQSGIFPESMVWKVAFSEKSGNLVKTFQELQRYFLQQFRILMGPIPLITEIACISILGFFVGTIALSVFLPIFRLQSYLSGG